MDVKTKVSLSYTTPDGYTTMDCKAIDYSVSEDALTIECPEIQQLHTALNRIDAARAKALREIETVHQYLDECYLNDPDEGRAVPLVDRVARLVSQLAEAQAEVERLRAAARALYDSFHAEEESYWSTHPRNVEAFARVFGLDSADNTSQDAAGG